MTDLPTLASDLVYAILAQHRPWDMPVGPSEEQAAQVKCFNDGVSAALDAVRQHFHNLGIDTP